MSNKQVRRFFGILDSEEELAVRRLRMLQAFAKNPKDAYLPLNAVYGHFLAEVAAQGSDAAQIALPWAEQWWQDMLLLGEVHADEMAEILDVLSAKTLYQLFCTERWAEVRATFADLDLKPLRARRRTAAIPPPSSFEPGTASTEFKTSQEDSIRTASTEFKTSQEDSIRTASTEFKASQEDSIHVFADPSFELADLEEARLCARVSVCGAYDQQTFELHAYPPDS